MPEEDDCTESMFNISKTHSRGINSDIKSVVGLRSRSPDIDTKEIKTIYVDCELFTSAFLMCLL